jgi:hypothetical protein
MATKTLKTRIKNRVDNLSNWFQTGVELLDGEIAIVRVPTGNTYVNPVTNKEEPVVELLMKVGATDSSGNCIAFENLPWMSAKASDVYDWAKEQDPSVVTVKYNKGTDAAPSWQESTLANILKDLETVEAAIATKADSTHAHSEYENQNAFSNIKVGTTTVAADSKTDTVEFVGSNVTITPDADNDKITFTVADASTNDKGIVKLSDSTDDKDNSTTAATSKAVAAAYQKAADAEAGLAGKSDSGHDHAGVYLPADTKYAGSDSQGGAATSAKKVENKLSITVGSGTATEFDGSGAKSISITLSDLGAASQEAVFGDDGNGGLKGEIAQVAADLTELTAAVSKGVNFRGEVAEAPSGNTYKLTTAADDADPTTAKVGDMVICGEKEYVYIAENSWKELGDLSRVGSLETAHTSVVTAGTYTKVTVGTNGHVTAGESPTTLAGYGIEDAYTKNDVFTKGEVNAALAVKAASKHTHSAYENQNAFNTIKVKKSGGTSTDVSVQADSATDTVEFEGTNIKITGTNGDTSGTDKIAFEVADATSSVAGVVKLSDTVSFTETSPAPAASNGKTAATPKAVATAYEAAQAADAKAADALEKAQHNHPYLLDTTTYAASDSVGGDATKAKQVANSLTIQLNSGTNTTGDNINKFVFNGSEATGIDITPASIGAAAANHSHTDMSSAIADMEEDLAENVVKYDATNQKLVVGTMGGATQDEIMIIDCGGAEGWD